MAPPVPDVVDRLDEADPSRRLPRSPHRPPACARCGRSAAGAQDGEGAGRVPHGSTGGGGNAMGNHGVGTSACMIVVLRHACTFPALPRPGPPCSCHQVGAMSADDESLTPLGRHLAVLPVDPRLGKLLVLGAVLGCLAPVLVSAWRRD
jgi:hypothetical protein